jgi:hypothetical protein
MAENNHRSATSLSWIFGLALIASCSTPPLQGTTSCFGEFTCGSGQLCKEQASGAAGDASISDGCVTVPDGCAIEDCTGSACAPCIMQLCDPSADFASVHGRFLDCSF